MPEQLQGTSTGIVLSTAGLTPLAVTVPVALVAPALFTVDGSGVGEAMASGTASQGADITLFATGGGDLSLPVTVTINGEQATVMSVSPVLEKPGWFQIKITIPFDASTDAPAAVTLSVSDQPSQAGVTLELRGN